MTAWTNAQAVLAEARARRDTRSIHAAEQTVRLLMTQQLRAEMRPQPAPSPTMPIWRRVLRGLVA